MLIVLKLVVIKIKISNLILRRLGLFSGPFAYLRLQAVTSYV